MQPYVSLTDEQSALLSRAHEFAEKEIKPLARAIDEGAGISRELIGKMGEERYLGATFPQELGGLGLDPIMYGLLSELIGVACCNTRALLTLQVSLVGESLLKWGSREQIERWIPAMAEGKVLSAFALTEPHVGSDAKNIQATYAKQNDGYVLNAHKKWITFGDIADVFLVIARQGDAITAFIVERDRGVRSKPIPGLLGMRGSHVAEVFLENVFVPEENVVGGVGNGFTYVTNTALDHGRYSIAWAGQSICQAALEAIVAYVRTRSQFGKRLHEFQLVQGMVAEATMRTHAGRALCLRAAELRKRNDPRAVMETTIAKYYTSIAANDVTADAVQLHGANGVSSEYPVQRLYREAKIMEIIEGSTQIQQMLVSKYALQTYRR